MALFKFIETFFFISLAITFLLVLLLVYHFKQRLGLLEQKTDNMFEIVNNIVKELNNIRNAQMNSNQFSGFPQVPQLKRMSPPFFVPPTPQDVNNIYVSVTENTHNETKKPDEDDEDSDDEDDEDSDDEDDDEDEDDSDKEVIIENLDDTKIETIEDNIKVVHMEELSNIDFELVSEISKNAVEPIQIEKLEELVIESETISTGQPVVVGEYSKDIVRKMSVQELKTLVITKGLCSDPSKMKKTELIKLIENNQE